MCVGWVPTLTYAKLLVVLKRTRNAKRSKVGLHLDSCLEKVWCEPRDPEMDMVLMVLHLKEDSILLKILPPHLGLPI